MANTHTQQASLPSEKRKARMDSGSKRQGNQKGGICVPQCPDDQKNIAELVTYLGSMYYR
ncbi:hypothetical protein [Allohahella sp. A8]|uniref:hypothetical protein n=1 Tax=Allohahella sp. A8 TaxID=3141461 RepID=UPI003A7FB2BA